jgi:hypothetical protein
MNASIIRQYRRAAIRQHREPFTPFGVFTNITDSDDRQTVGGWYLHVHCWPFVLQLWGTR